MRQEAKASTDSNKMTFIQSEELESLAVIANTLALHHGSATKSWIPSIP